MILENGLLDEIEDMDREIELPTDEIVQVRLCEEIKCTELAQ